MEQVWTSLVENAPVAMALLWMTRMWMQRDERRDAQIERIVDRSLEAEAATRAALQEIASEVREVRSTLLRGDAAS